MPTHVTPKAGLAIKYDSTNKSIDGNTPSGVAFDLASPYKSYAEGQSAAAAYADITLGTVGWANASFISMKNNSTTSAEIINILVEPQVVAGGADDGTFDGGALGNTLTAAGYYKRCTVAGTSQGKTWAVGDIAFYLGSSGAYLQIRPQKLKLRPGLAMEVELNGVNAPMRFNSASGTPRMEILAAGPLA